MSGPIVVNAKNADEVAAVLQRFVEPFPEPEIKLKPAKVSGTRCLALAYIDARCVMDRLDEVVGINNWRDEYTVLPGGTEVECRLSVRIAGEWITKADVGGESEQPDSGDKMKAAYSDALKRAAVKFGIGRFLYRRPQTWMDYDPVKKQIIRPSAGGQQKPAAKPEPQAQKMAVKDNHQLRARHAQSYGQCKSHADLLAARKAVVADIEAERLSAADAADLRKIDAITLAKFPANPQPAAV